MDSYGWLGMTVRMVTHDNGQLWIAIDGYVWLWVAIDRYK